MTARRWRVGLVGFGAYAEAAHLPAYLDNPAFEFTAIADPVSNRRDAAKRLAPAARTYSRIEHMLEESELDVVDVCSPAAFHSEHASIALLAGKHVVCEKPVTARVAEVQHLLALAEQRRCLFAAAHNYKFSPGIQRMDELLRQGGIGDPVRISIRIDRQGPAQGSADWLPGWRSDPDVSGGGILMDHAPHPLYLARLLARRPARAISARADGEAFPEHRARIHLRFDGLDADIGLSWKSATRRTIYRVTGMFGELTLYDYARLVIRNGATQVVESFAAASPDSWTRSMLESYADRFAEPEARGCSAEALFVAESLELAYASMRGGTAWLPLNHS